MKGNFKVTTYRWVILTVFILITVSIEIQWLTHAAVARPAEVFYSGQFDAGTFFNIDFLAMVYMLAFLVMSFPASYIINKFGIRNTLIFSSILLALFSILKAFLADNFIGILISQTGLAIAQPFILNSVTTVSARWFPVSERALAAGLLALAQYVGIIIAILLSPLLIVSNPDLPEYGSGFSSMLWIYASISLFASLSLIIFMRESPEGKNYHDFHTDSAFTKGIKLILVKRDMLILLFLFMIGLGIFNAISSMTDSIAEHAGVRDSDGLIGGLMLIGGIVGALILPALSDKYKKRKLFLIICLLGMFPGIAGLTFSGLIAGNSETTYHLLLISSFIVGFFMMSAGPIGFQYAAEISHPAPESVSQGMILWIGQLSGMLFVALMSIKNNQYLGYALYSFVVLAFITVVSVFFVKESPLMKTISGEQIL